MSQPLIIHFGAHRTSSTSAQKSISIHAHGLGAGQIAFAGPTETRPKITQLTHFLSATRVGARAAPTGWLRMASPEIAKVIDAPITRRVISDEQFLGEMGETILPCRGCYPTAGRRARLVRRGLGSIPATAVLTIRPYMDWFASMHAWRSTRQDMPHQRDLAPRWAASMETRGWAEAAIEIGDQFDALTVIDFRAVLEDPRAVITTLVGAEISREITPLHIGKTRKRRRKKAKSEGAPATAPSGAAHEAERSEKTRPPKRPGAKAPRKNKFFSPAMQDMLIARYEDDIDRLRAAGAAIISPEMHTTSC